MTSMLKELSEAPAVIKEAICRNKGIAEKIAAEVKRRHIDRIVVAARGSSLNAGLAFKFFAETKTKYTVSLEHPSVVTSFGARRKLSDALYVLISQSAVSDDLKKMAFAAQDAGALTVLVTNNIWSAIASTVNYVLDIGAGEERAVAATKTFTGEVAALQTLAYALAGKTMPDGFAQARAAEILSDPLPDLSGLAKHRHAVVLAQGYLEAVAKECSLKLAETCYMYAMPYSVNEFQHGPKAVAEKGDLAVMFAYSGRRETEYVETAKMLKGIGAELLIFTDMEALGEYADVTVKMPALAEDEVPLLYAVKMQAAVEALCSAKGLDPDSPRYLRKITITE